MDSRRWQGLQELFLQALGQEGEARVRFLDEATAGDVVLRRELEDMLAAHESSEDSGWLARAPTRAREPSETPSLPEHVGPYRILELIGQGGMGQVFLAERADDQYRQRVALKVVRSDFGTDFLKERFRTERQILAQLQHPSISTLLDGGVTDDGRPYLVMQYEPGIRITEYCDEHLLSIRERLTLFAKVCEAVQFAHANLVVHRDLKPSNILVSEQGHPKLLDFGIAKILAGGDAFTRAVTGEIRLMTPEHAAPEQIRGEPVTTAVDVYSLGVLLYELLVGERPFKSTDTTPLLLQKKICEEAPTRPSDEVRRALARPEDPSVQTGVADLRRTRPAALVNTLTGDLDQIVLMALRKEPERRYESVAEFAGDVRRYLRGHPVHARADTFGYRVGKFVRRNRVGVGFAATLVLSLAGFAGAMTFQQGQTAMERDRAELELAKSETIAAFLADLFRANRPQDALGDTATARDLLERGVGRIDSLDSQPELQNSMLLLLGDIYLSLGENAQAARLIERALAQREQTLQPPHSDLAYTLHAMGRLRFSEGDYGETLRFSEAALEQQRAVREPDDRAIAASLELRARALGQLDSLEGAETAYRDLIAHQREAFSPNAPQVATALHNLGRVLDRAAKYGESEASYRAALEIDRSRYPEHHPTVAITLTSLGTALQRQRKFGEAVDLLEEVVAIQRTVVGPDHPRLATSLSALGNALNGAERPQEAIERLEEAATIYRSALGPDHPNVATVLYNTGRVAHGTGDLGRAEILYREALRIRAAALGPDHSRTALIEVFLGKCLTERGNLVEAEGLLRHALEINLAQFGEDHTFTEMNREFLDAWAEAAGSVSAPSR